MFYLLDRKGRNSIVHFKRLGSRQITEGYGRDGQGVV